MPKLSKAQLKLLLIKCAHLIAVIVVLVFMAFHFHLDNKNVTEENSFSSDVIKDSNETYVSIYEKFNQPQSDEDLPTINVSGAVDISHLIDESDNDYEELSTVAELETSTELTYDKDIPQLYEQLYEETLPDDIIDDDINTNQEKPKNLSIIPARKPAYFGKDPVIAIIIDDMGINHHRTSEISSLQYPLTASFLTYGSHINQQADVARASGQEIILHAPMEALGKVENAPDVLTSAMSTQQIKDNLQIMLQKVKDIKGINNHMGSKLTQDKERMLAVMEVLKDKDLFFLDSRTSSQSVADQAAKEIGVKYATRHIFLDNNNDKAYILQQLQHTENLARKNGYAIAIGHPKSQTYAALKEWLPQMKDKKLKLMHLSKIINILNR